MPRRRPLVDGKRPVTPDDFDRQRRHRVKVLASTQVPLKQIAEMLDISVRELRRDYRVELHWGHEYVYAHITGRLVDMAFKGDIRAMLAWLRQYGGWQEVSRKELTGKNGEPVSIQSLDAASLSAIISAISEKNAPGRGKGRATTQISLGAGAVTDLEPIPGSADTGSEE